MTAWRKSAIARRRSSMSSSEPTTRRLHGRSASGIFQPRGETWPREQRDLTRCAEPRYEPEPERARIVGRMHLRAGEERERRKQLQRAEEHAMARDRPRLGMVLRHLAGDQV